MSKVIGVKIDSKSDKYTDKIYYYETDDNSIKKGDTMRLKMPSGGTPEVYVSIANSKKKIENIKPIQKKS